MRPWAKKRPADISCHRSAGAHIKHVKLISLYFLRCKCFIPPRITKALPTDGRTDGPTDGWMDGRTDTPSYRDARTHLKKNNRNEVE